MIKKIIQYLSFYAKLKFNKKLIPLCYFDEVKNVGDALNLDIIKYISGKDGVKVPSTKLFKHLCAVGSVLSSMNHNSVVWGSGLISEDAINTITELGDIRAVRGFYSKQKIEEKFNVKLKIPLGDPALLLPRMYNASQKKDYEFGLVLHYMDETHPIIDKVQALGGNIIYVSLPVADFIEELTRCNAIISSSMHGLIISDAYNIPNKRIILGDKIVGGDFKYRDYYSTTVKPDELGIHIAGNIRDTEIYDLVKMADVKNTILDLEDLYQAFPKDVF